MANKNNKGLGKGIGAIFSEFEANDANEEIISEISLDAIKPNPYQPRKHFDETKLNDLAKSIKSNGVFQPIILRKAGSNYEIISGERRFRASILAGKDVIPAVVRLADEDTMMEIAILENLQREDLNPIEEARAFDSLMNQLKLTQNEVAEKLGKSRSYIANMLRLLNLPDEVKAMVESEQLQMGQARTMLALKDQKGLKNLANKVIKEGLTVRQIEKLVNELNDKKTNLKTNKASSNKFEPFFVDTANQLSEMYSVPAKVRANQNNSGTIELKFKDIDEFNELMIKLGIDTE